MTNKVESFDVIIVGGGPSGLMASIAAREAGASTLLIEKGNKLGRKLGISGGGRCNVTNAKPLDELMQNIPGNSRFLYSALNRFSNQEIIAFFEHLGIRLKEEDRGRVFPVSDKAATVVQALVDEVYQLGVEVWTETPVRGLLVSEQRVHGVRLHNQREILAPAVVLATGGCSVPKTGSTGDAYPWAKSVGHAIVDPFPTEVPLTSQDALIRSRVLQGLSLRGIDMSVILDGKKRLTTEYGDMIFTHFGLSGPAALRCSHYVSTALLKNPHAKLHVEIDCKPNMDLAAVESELEAMKKTSPKRHLGNLLADWFSDRLIDAILAHVKQSGAIPMNEVRKSSMESIARAVKAFPIEITGTLPLSQATVTGGGVSVREIQPKTMASKICQGLYFCGELMDVHAHTGGYNITVAFSTGHLAGESAALYAQSMNADAPL